MPQPSVGRVAHYVARGSADGAFPPACRAAIITQAGAWVDGEITHIAEDGETPVGAERARHRVVSQTWHDDAVWLHAMNPTGTFTYGPMLHDEGDPSRLLPGEPPSPLCTGRLHTPGSWHWPAILPEGTGGS